MCTNPVGRVLYRNCGRLLRRALAFPALFSCKMLTSIIVFYSAWYLMHLGGALATFRFPRVNQTYVADALPDILFETLGNTDTLWYCGRRDDW